MSTVREAMTKGFEQWFTESMNYTIGVIKGNWLTGPRPERLGVVKGNLRSRIVGKTVADGFVVGTRVVYGIAWEKGIKAHTIRAKGAKALMIPLGSHLSRAGRWTGKLKRATGLTKIKGGGKLRSNLGNLAIFRKSVHIPKQAPRKFLEPGAREALPSVYKIGNRIFGDAFISACFKNKTVGK